MQAERARAHTLTDVLLGRREIRPAGSASAERSGATVDPILAELVRRLARHGGSRAFVERVSAGVRARRSADRHALDLAAEVIGELFPPAGFAKLERKTRVLAFVGATGVGKTTTLIKLARRLKAAGRTIELATLADPRPPRLGADLELRAWSRRLELPLTVLQPRVRVQPGAFAAAKVDLVLLDTPSVSRARGVLEGLGQTFRAAAAAFDVCLVLSAAASAAAHARVRAELAALRPQAAVITKLDETLAPLGALEAALAAEAAVAFLADGPDVESFQRADGEKIADLCLRGRLA